MKVSVKAIPFLVRDRRVLMLREAEYDGGNNPGMWDLPGGTMEEGETYLDTLVREFKEEAGITLPAGTTDRIMDCMILHSCVESTMRIYIPMPMWCNKLPIVLSSHHSEAYWFGKYELPTKGNMMPRLHEIIARMFESWGE